MFVRSIRALARGQTFALFLMASAAMAEDKEPLAILQLGAAAERSLNNGGFGLGPTAAVEFEPIKNRLEVETGISTLFSKGQTDWDTNLVFKKPIDLTPFVEFEPGIGPVWIHAVGKGRTTDAIGAEVIAEFMFWSTPDRKFGWFLEPSYTYSFSNGHEQSLGVSVGLLVPIK